MDVSSDRITPMCLTHLEGVQKHPILRGQHGTTRIYNHGKNNHLQSWYDPLSRLMLFFFCILYAKVGCFRGWHVLLVYP